MSSREEREIALQAMNRAATQARERAARHGIKIGIWNMGEIMFVDPEQNAQQDGAGQPATRPESK